MANEILIYANHEVARRYRQKMDIYGLICLAIFLISVATWKYWNLESLFGIVPGIFLLMSLLMFWSRNSMLNDARDGLLVFRFTYDGWYMNESKVLYRWGDFKRVNLRSARSSFMKQNNTKLSALLSRPC